jgi:hypothetical protein
MIPFHGSEHSFLDDRRSIHMESAEPTKLVIKSSSPEIRPGVDIGILYE